MTTTYPNLIDGQSVDSAERTPDINPSNLKDVVGEFAAASVTDLERAIASVIENATKPPKVSP